MKEGFDSPRDRHFSVQRVTYYVYIIETIRNKRKITYTGYSSNLKKRINLHNNGKGAKFTRGSFWKLIYKKKFDNKTDAMKYEYLLKNKKSIKMKIIKK